MYLFQNLPPYSYLLFARVLNKHDDSTVTNKKYILELHSGEELNILYKTTRSQKDISRDGLKIPSLVPVLVSIMNLYWNAQNGTMSREQYQRNVINIFTSQNIIKTLSGGMFLHLKDLY